jgi:hypothetical protein
LKERGSEWKGVGAIARDRDRRKAFGKFSIPLFLNSRDAARYRALASIMPGSENFFWNLSF